MITNLQPFGHLGSEPLLAILASTAMQDEQLHPDFAAELDGLAPRFEALGLSDIAARLRALTAEPRSESPQAAPQLGRLLELQLLSILDETDQA